MVNISAKRGSNGADVANVKMSKRRGNRTEAGSVSEGVSVISDEFFDGLNTGATADYFPPSSTRSMFKPYERPSPPTTVIGIAKERWDRLLFQFEISFGFYMLGSLEKTVLYILLLSFLWFVAYQGYSFLVLPAIIS